MDETQIKENTAPVDFDAEQKARKKQLIVWGLIVTGIVSALVIGMLLLFTGNDDPVRTQPPTVAVFSQTSPAVPTAPGMPTAAPTGVPFTTAGQETTLYYGTAPLTTIPASTTAPVAATVPQQTVTAAQTPSQTTAPAQTAAQFTSAQGSMIVDTSADNRFIKIVADAKGISPSLLTAVYVLPDTGQNYVMEWNGTTDASGKLLRTADAVRRCYLIDTAGQIGDIAATDFNECVGMSRLENSVAMETLIKGILIPQIERSLVS